MYTLKNLFAGIILAYILIAGLFYTPTLFAQNHIGCGDVVTAEFTGSNEIHQYTFSGEAESRAWVVGFVDPAYQRDLSIRLQVVASNGRELVNTVNFITQPYAYTFLPETSTYDVFVDPNGQFGGRYSLSLSCIDDQGLVTSTAPYVQQAQCGNIIDSNFGYEGEEHYYYLLLQEGTIITARGEVSPGYTADLRLRLSLGVADGRELDDTINSFNSVSVTSEIVESGIHYLEYAPTGGFGGRYTVFIRCVLSDGTVIEPGDAVPIDPLTSSEEDIIEPSGPTSNNPLASLAGSVSTFTGFGFPGIGARDFSQGIEIPLQLGQAQTAPIGSEVALYTYSASEGEARTLRLTRLGGDLSMGVAVIKQATNEIVLFAGMPSGNNFSAELVFPSDGEYAIGIFRIDLPGRTETSGAVQLTLE